MSREAHVQFWEGLAVRFRWATQLSESLRLGQPRPPINRQLPELV
jgi:hypothetical protein